MKIKDISIIDHQTAKASSERVAAIKVAMTGLKDQIEPDCKVKVYQTNGDDHVLVEVWTYPDMAAKMRCLQKWRDTKTCPPEQSVLDGRQLEVAGDIIWND